MPHPDDLDRPRGVADAVDDAAGRADDLPQGRIAKLRDHSAHLGELGQMLDSLKYAARKTARRQTVVLRDVGDQLAEVLSSDRRLAQLVSHWENSSRTRS